MVHMRLAIAVLLSSRGDPWDAFQNSSFTDLTDPAALLNSGSPSGVSVNGIGPSARS